MEKVIQIISRIYGVDPLSKCRQARYVESRMVIWSYLRFHSIQRYSTVAIAKKFKMHHTSIINGSQRFTDLCNTEVDLKIKYETFVDLLNAKMNTLAK